MAGLGWGRDVENECDFGPGQLEVPVVLSNGSCYMGLELWGNSGLKLETPQACITTSKPTAVSLH